MRYLLSEVRRFQRIAGLLKEDDIDLSDTPEFERKPRTVKEYFNNKKFEDFIAWLVDMVVRDFANGQGWWDLGKSVEGYLESTMSLEDMEGFWEEYREGEGAREDLDEADSNDINLSDTPKFGRDPDLWDEAFRDFVWDRIEGHYEELYGTIDPDDISDIIGQYLMNLPYNEVEALWRDYMKDKRAGMLENDIDLSDTPEFKKQEKSFRGDDYRHLLSKPVKSKFEKWIIELFEIIIKEAELEPDEIVVTDVRDYYKEGKTPAEVFFDVWGQDAGHYYAF